ncbi:peptide ABC transporter ATP-binding protein [Bordetella genomosp. 10]|uniref:Peptide ABC transporter ATP-binding protein n=1 Tax=Bordetella genomosp. 10 TaxID=1416804 RepID=A0A261S7Z1_9BORD|nr:ABC transporter ATP-binding protein [Bordetella genomosp. 10]OZI32543.1 peptide ABC transporter ATP-binding protein [Bordetella genomosp. 10]
MNASRPDDAALDATPDAVPAPARTPFKAPGAPVIELTNVHKRFEQRPDLAQRLLALAGRPLDRRTVHAVNGVSLSIARGEVVGLVGESGCGKSTLGRVVAGLYRQTEGELRYQGRPVAELRGRDRLDYVLGVQMVFQDPQASLNPRQRLRQILGESLKVHKLAPAAEIPARVDSALASVGLDREYRDRLPHQISGGQRQRIGIARALMVSPSFLVCDEPVAALDVSIQAQVINLFMDLREQHDLTYLFISHDLGVVRHISDRVAIMYLGKIVELSTAAEIFARANHPYTQALLAEVPDVARRGRKFTPIKGEIPSPLAPPPGCAFNPRCPHAMPRCREQVPPLKEIAPGHWSACHLNEAAA